jgi:hypothetical protein
VRERFKLDRLSRPAPSGETPLFRSPFEVTAVDVYVDGRADANWPVGGATVRLYLIAGTVRTLVTTSTGVGSGKSRAAVYRGAGIVEATIELGAGAELVSDAAFAMVGFGRRL